MFLFLIIFNEIHVVAGSHQDTLLCKNRFSLTKVICFCLLTDPPSQPLISGYVEGSIIPAGSVQKLLCVSTGGNPLATLTWYKNDKKVMDDKMVIYVCMCRCMFIYSEPINFLFHFQYQTMHAV